MSDAALAPPSPPLSVVERFDRHPTAATLRLALPAVGENFLLLVVTWSDLILTGRVLVEPAFVAAFGLSAYLVWFVKACSDLVGAGAQAVVARLVGEGNDAQARHVALQALMLAVVLGAALAAAVLAGAGAVTAAMNLRGDTQRLAAEYLRTLAPAVPLLTVSLVGAACFRAVGRTEVGLIVGLAENTLNVALCWLLVLGPWGLPRLGWGGLSVAMAVAYAGAGVVLLALLARGRHGLHLFRPRPLLDLRAAGRVLAVGAGGAAHALGLVLCHLVFLRIIAGLGDVPLAAHTAAVQVEALSYLVGEGFAVAAGALAGQALGAGRPDLAKRAARRCLLVAMVSMTAAGVFFWFAADAVVALLVTEPAIRAQAAPLLWLVALSEPALALVVVYNGVLRGVGDTRVLFAITVTSLLGVRVPLAVALTTEVVGLGVWGAWVAMAADLLVRALLLTWRVRSGRWLRVKV